MKRLIRSLLRPVRRYPRTTAAITLGVLILYLLSLPRPLFDAPTCMVLEDRNGDLLGARIAADGQWRFPAPDSLPARFIQALLTFEDHRFYRHLGVDPISLGRAFVQNIREGHIVSGGSTITMQVIRMARNNPPRTWGQKLVEMILATRLELGYSKDEILRLYATHAPFGGNVVGLEAASWRYYAKPPATLSWAEAVTLAVLPNSPSLIYPGRNRELLLAKRNRLLDRLHQRGIIDEITLELAREEELPAAPLPLPRLAPHLLDRAYLEYVRPDKNSRSRIRTTLLRGRQEQLATVLERHQQRLSANGVHNLAAFVVEVETGEVIAYAGNVPGAGVEHGESVDIITAPRSTGSILKPFLYAAMLQEGSITSESLVPDIPTTISGYRPENFYEQFDGLVPAQRALVRSLNVPFVYLLQRYGVEKFHYRLRQLDFSHLTFSPDHYGLSLILGGAEASLWDITSAYASMARTLRHVYRYQGEYDARDFRHPHYLFAATAAKPDKPSLQRTAPHFDYGSIWLTFAAMQEVERPDEEGEWQYFRSGRQVAWKTGTSFGFRDAWAVGVTPRYAVGVWAGNADGEGRAGLIGVRAAAPVLFDIINGLPPGEEAWFEQPYDHLLRWPICAESGYRPGEACPRDTIWATRAAGQLATCPYHQWIHLDPLQQLRVNSSCELPDRMQRTSWLVLPPLEAHYYRIHHPSFQPLPPYRQDCRPAEQEKAMQLIYPPHPTRIFVPVDLDGQLSRTVFAVAHRQPATLVHWHIDGEYLGSTSTFHSMEFNPAPGPHRLVLVDEQGHRLEQAFEIISKRNGQF